MVSLNTEKYNIEGTGWSIATKYRFSFRIKLRRHSLTKFNTTILQKLVHSSLTIF